MTQQLKRCVIMSNQPAISVIVPIYNMEKYLKKCIDSIVNQTYKNLEIILVDDGSTDSSASICDKYARKDSRIKSYHKPNGGLADAKNYGLQKSSCEYVAFVDADDWVDNTMYETMVFALQRTNSDIVICGRYIEYENQKAKKWNYPNELTMDSTEALIYLNSCKNIDMASWDKIYKRQLFDDITFPAGKKCEDAYTTYLLFYKAKRVSYVPECLYHYFQRPNSISRNQNLNLDYVYAAKEQLDFFQEKLPHLVYVAETNYAFSIKALYQTAVERHIPIPTELRQEQHNTKKYYKAIIKNKHISNKKKITFTLFAYCPTFYRVLLKIKFSGGK